MNIKTNEKTSRIVELRYIGKEQMTAEDMGGVGCDAWKEYKSVCSILACSAWYAAIGAETDNNIIDTAIAGMMEFFGISVTDVTRYRARVLCALVERKPQRSQSLKDAMKEKKHAKALWTAAVESNEPETKIAKIEQRYNELCEHVEELYEQPNNYWFDPVPMIDKKKQATAKARKAIEDTFADIYLERRFMTEDQLKAEKQRLDDERKGREIRKKKEKASAK